MAVPSREFGTEQTWIVAQRIRRRRHELGLTQEQLLDRLMALGMSTTDGTISNYERGSGLWAGKLPILALALESTVTYLLGLTDNAKKWTPDITLEEAVATRAFLHGNPSKWIQPPIVVAL